MSHAGKASTEEITRFHEAVHVATALCLDLPVTSVDLSVVTGTQGTHVTGVQVGGVDTAVAQICDDLLRFYYAPSEYEQRVLGIHPYTVDCAGDGDVESAEPYRNSRANDLGIAPLEYEFMIRTSCHAYFERSDFKRMIELLVERLKRSPFIDRDDIYALWSEACPRSG